MALVELEQRGHIGLITINRPEVLNALNVQTLRELDAILDQVENDEDIFVLIIISVKAQGIYSKAAATGASKAIYLNFLKAGVLSSSKPSI